LGKRRDDVGLSKLEAQIAMDRSFRMSTPSAPAHIRTYNWVHSVHHALKKACTSAAQILGRQFEAAQVTCKKQYLSQYSDHAIQGAARDVEERRRQACRYNRRDRPARGAGTGPESAGILWRRWGVSKESHFERAVWIKAISATEFHRRLPGFFEERGEFTEALAVQVLRSIHRSRGSGFEIER
jgi:hypothetical protein